jgi:hypothetical protein
VDARLHHVQGKTGLVTDLQQLLEEFYREKVTLLLRHESGSRLVPQYDVNNTYQYIVNREEAHLSWVGRSLSDLGATVPADAAQPERNAAGKGAAAARAIIEEDAREVQAFVDRWKPRVETMTNARHRGMLRVILGEMLEQKRFFDQALAGRMDLLGRRTEDVGPRVGAVLPTRWIE